MTFPSAVPLNCSSSTAASPSTSAARPSYHTRLLSSPYPGQSADTIMITSDFGPAITSHSVRSGLAPRHSALYRHSLVKVSSPLRQQVDEPAQPKLRKTTSLMGIGGLLSPPSSPEDGPKPPPPQTAASAAERNRHINRRSMSDKGSWSSITNKHLPLPGHPLSSLPTPPNSPPIAPASPVKKAPPKRTASGLWADSKPATPSSLSQPAGATDAVPVDFAANASAPKFSRSSLKKSAVIMPVAAPRSHSTSSLNSLLNTSGTPSLRSSPSASSLKSISSLTAPKPKSIRRQTSVFGSQDRLASLAETSKRELQLNEEGLLALDSLSPPRPAFMHRTSNSSISSLSSLTSAASSTPTSLTDACDTISEEAEFSPTQVTPAREADPELPISCTKSDADAEGSVESSSMKSGLGAAKGKKKGGLFKRLTKVLGLEKKAVPGHEGGRRGSM